MIKNKLAKGLNIALCSMLLSTTLINTIGPPIIANASEIDGTFNLIPPSVAWTAEEWKEIEAHCPTDTYLHPLRDTGGGHAKEGFAIGLRAKSSDPSNNKRYASIVYEIQWRSYTFVVGADEIKDFVSNGETGSYYKYISSEKMAKALVAQGQCSSEAEAKSVVDTMVQEKGAGDEIYSTTYYAFTRNGAIKPTTSRVYASGSITLSATGKVLFQGVDIDEILGGSRTDLLEAFKDAMMKGGSTGAAKAASYGLSKTSQEDIKRNAHRKIQEPVIDINPVEVPDPVIPPPTETRTIDTMVQYHTWDNTEKDRNSTSSYYVTYNDSREYEDSDGHHDPFTAEDSNGIVIPSSEKFVNGVENDAYWGDITFGLLTDTKTYSATYDYSYKLVYWEPHDHQEEDGKDEAGNTKYKWVGAWHSHGTQYETVTVYAPRKAYNYVFEFDKANLYDFAESTAYNDAFLADELSYYKDEDHVVNTEIGPSTSAPVMDGVTTTTETPSYIAEIGNITWLDVNPSDDERHNLIGYISGPTDGGFTSKPESKARPKAQDNLNYHVGDGKTQQSHLRDGTAVESFAKVKTDKFEIDYNGTSKIFMKGDEKWVRFDGTSYDHDSSFSASGAAAIPYLSSLYPKNMFLTSNGGGVDVNTFETTPAFNKVMTNVPDDQSNGQYPTEVDATYKAAKSTDGKNLASGKKEFAKGNKIKGSYTMNEPVVVQTPVISPVELYRDNGQDLDTTDPRVSSSETDALYKGGTVKDVDTQLITGKANSGLPQLRLDETYWFKFSTRAHLEHMGYRDADTHSNAWDNLGDTDSKYDKYVDAKYVHFPVDVILYTNGDPKYIKHVANESDPGYWTTLEASDWEYVKFYVPVWAKEGEHSSGDDQIRYKVDAINVISDDDSGQGAGDHRTDPSARERELNDHGDGDSIPDKELYVATYDIPVQISGWIYDFQVVGINDARTYDANYTENKNLQSTWYALCPTGEEKKTGPRNRLGGDNRFTSIFNFVRKTFDGSLVNPWSARNTITIGAGSSNKYKMMGEQRKGTKFAYSVRTISNLWHDEDYLTIKPTFRYVNPKTGLELKQNSTGSDKLYVYYHDISGDYKELYIPYGSSKDQSLVNSVQIGGKEFTGSYYDRDLKQTASYPRANYNSTGDVVSFTNTKSGSTEDQNTFLQKSIDSYTLSGIKLPSGLRMFSGDLEQLRDNLDKEGSSVSTLDDLFETGSETSRLNSLLENSMQTWYGEYYVPSELFVSKMSPSEIENYAVNHGGLDENDENVWIQDGYLVINFDIVSVKEHQQDLQYGGNNDGSNMWKNEGQKTTVKVPDQTHPNQYIDIPVNDGDVIVIDNGRSTNDETEARIFMIN